jgi:hypothetical protein
VINPIDTVEPIIIIFPSSETALIMWKTVLFITNYDNLTLIIFNKEAADISEIVCICSFLCRLVILQGVYFFARSFEARK